MLLSPERQKHMQMYPHWNARDNYRFGQKKKKRKRDKTDDPGILKSFPFSFFSGIKFNIMCWKLYVFKKDYEIFSCIENMEDFV